MMDEGGRSTKVHHAPGGSSNFSIAGDSNYEAPKPKNQTPFYETQDTSSTKVKNQHYSSSFSLGGPTPGGKQAPSSKPHFNQSNVYTGSSSVGGDKGQYDAPASAHTSVKVRNPPGGASSITF